MADLDLCPESRSHQLRQMYWDGEHNELLTTEVLAGSGEPGLVGRARDFAILLEATPPVIQPVDQLAGLSTARLGEGSTLQLGEYDGHYTPGHAKIIRMGYTAIRQRAEEKLATETDPDRRDFLEATALTYRAASEFAAKHAVHARALARVTPESERRAELERMGDVCQEIATGVATSFQAGLQVIWFTFIFGGRGSIGRFDQWLYPLYAADLESGRLNQVQAQELLENYFIKVNYFAPNNDSLRNIAMAGQTPDGEDACNALTIMCLKASGKLMLPEPKLNVRFFSGSSPELLELSCRLTCKGLSNPAYFNDEVAIPGLLQLGIPIEDARDYCNDGCSELIIGGKSTIRFQCVNTLNLLNETVARALEAPFGSFADVMDDFLKRVEGQIPTEPAEPRPVTFPYFAASLEDCLEQASVTGARYSIRGRILSQLGNVADGLAAIKRFICEEQSLTWEELGAALANDYEGSERLRQRILNRAPKFGNDDDEVDDIIRAVAEHFCDRLLERVDNGPGPGTKTAPGFMAFGIHGQRGTPATPDGRRQGDNVANSLSPAPGRDRNSPTAVLKSVSKMDLRRAGHGSVLDIAFHPTALRGEEGFQKFVAFVRTFLDMPCTTTLQVNMVDRDQLLAARDNPEDPQFRTLLVRVWGWSAVFVELDPALQEHVIERTEHSLS